MVHVSAVVPAAGLSTRMGGPNKLLSPYGSSTVVGAVVGKLLDCGLPVVVVTGRDQEKVAKAVEPARCVFNPFFEQGLGTSIAQGVRSIPEDHAILIALGDMPDLSKDTVSALVENASLDTIVIPHYAEQPSTPPHPVLFGPVFRTLLLALNGDVGARSVIEANVSAVRRMEFPGSLTDIDSPIR